MGKTKKINPLRFVYYVADVELREEIKRKGIKIKKDHFKSKKPERIYVYNEKRQPDYSWYPFFFFDFYDYWQIDTSKIENKWFKDDWAIGNLIDFKSNDPNHNYIFTDSDVTASALKLFRFQQEKFYFSIGEKETVHLKYIGEFRPYNENESFL